MIWFPSLGQALRLRRTALLRQLRVMGCRCGYVGTTTGVARIADDLRRRQSRQPWAKTCRPRRKKVAGSGLPGQIQPVPMRSRPR